MIIKSAIKIGDNIILGKRHGDCVELVSDKSTLSNSITGFINDKGEFKTRAESAKEAFECGQIKEEQETLISEDLW